VPNFLEAQTRAKVSRAKSDMRTLATALESYYVDNNNYAPSAPVDAENGPNSTFASGSTPPDPLLKQACEWWTDQESSWDPDTSISWDGDPAPMSAFLTAHPSVEQKDFYEPLLLAPNKQRGYDVKHPKHWGGSANAWYSNGNGLTIPMGGTGFVALSTPISYISDPQLNDPWMSGQTGSASFVKYVACNKFMPIGFVGGSESYATSKTGAVHTMISNNPQSASLAPAATGGGDNKDFDAREDSQILWWALYCVGPDKTDSIVIEENGSDVRKDMMDMWSPEFEDLDGGNDSEREAFLASMVGAHVYDPTNGTKSGGEIWRIGGGRPNTNLDQENSDGDVFDDGENYSASPFVYKYLSQMVK
jgi:type II secretory pathway pseudopilin PulG